MKKISGEALLAIGGALILASFAYLNFLPQAETESTQALAELSAFEKGEYYFNHDDDPGGAYDIALAKQYYSQALTEEPENPYALYQYGRIQFIEGDFEGALSSFYELEERFGTRIPNMYYMLGLVHGYKGRVENDPQAWEQAEEAFEKFITFAPKSPWPRVDLAWVYFAQGKFAEMKPVLEEGLVHYPENPWLLNMHGLALFNLDETESALLEFKKAHEEALQLTPEDWGRSYPGNDPAAWALGLEEFRTLIQKNINLAGGQ